MSKVCDYHSLRERVAVLAGAHKALECGVLARSILGREIPILTLGKGSVAVLYVGAHHGTDHVTADVLLQFVGEYLALLEKNAQVFGKRMKYIYEYCKIIVVPMLNPDGVEYATNGVGAENPLRERVVVMNGGSDFSAWQANARGVDLCHNYNAGFEAYKVKEFARGIPCGAPRRYSGEFPESEPETAALCRFLRHRREQIKGVISLESAGEQIFCSCADKLSAKSLSVGRILQRTTGYRLVSPERLNALGGLSDWCIEHLSRPAYTLACGKNGAAQPPSQSAAVYAKLKEALFTFPFML